MVPSDVNDKTLEQKMDILIHQLANLQQQVDQVDELYKSLHSFIKGVAVIGKVYIWTVKVLFAIGTAYVGYKLFLSDLLKSVGVTK